MYRRIGPESEREMPLRMLFQPTGDGLFHRACEADGFRGLVAALIGDPGYETADLEARLVARLRLAHDARLLAEIEGRSLAIGDRDGPDTINVATDEKLIRTLHWAEFVSLEPSVDTA